MNVQALVHWKQPATVLVGDEPDPKRPHRPRVVWVLSDESSYLSAKKSASG